MKDKKPNLELYDHEMARIACYGLIVACPFDNNEPDCQFHEMRKWPILERINWIQELSDTTCMNFYKTHCNCVHNTDED